jgi:DNA-binding Lrp family transcriptional regulator
MIKLLNEHEIDAQEALKNINGVEEAYQILGEYGLFVILQSKNLPLLYSIVNEIREHPNVTSIWHLLISGDDPNSKEDFTDSGISNVESNYDPNLSNSRKAANLCVGHWATGM